MQQDTTVTITSEVCKVISNEVVVVAAGRTKIICDTSPPHKEMKIPPPTHPNTAKIKDTV